MEQGTSALGDKAVRRHANFIDRTGQRYGKLVVIRAAEPRFVAGSGKSRFFWLCQCDCGNETEVWSWSLSSGTTGSCGCLIVPPTSPGGPKPWLPPGRRARNQVLKNYKINARRRGLRWDLTGDDFDRLTSQSCFYCGLPPSLVVVAGESRFVYTGIDRTDNTLGYTPENTVPCCKTCNRAKRAMPYDEFMAWIARLAAYHWFRPDVTPVS